MEEFPLADVLRVVTSHPLNARNSHGVEKILHFMTGTAVIPRDVPTVSSICAGAICAQQPALASIPTPPYQEDRTAVVLWLEERQRAFGPYVRLSPLPGNKTEDGLSV